MSGSSARAVGVIGAGGSGVAAATALQRAGIDFEVLEARDGVGGTWRYDPEGDGSACYASLVANTSKLRMQILRPEDRWSAMAVPVAQGDARLPRIDRGSAKACVRAYSWVGVWRPRSMPTAPGRFAARAARSAGTARSYARSG